MTELDQKRWIESYHEALVGFDEAFWRIREPLERHLFASVLAMGWMLEHSLVGSGQGCKIFEREKKYRAALSKLQASLGYVSSMTTYPPWEIKHYNGEFHSACRTSRDVLLWLARQPVTRNQAKRCNELAHVLQRLVIHLDVLRTTLKVSYIEPSIKNGDVFELTLDD